jgi:hypothetical protein
MIWPDPRLKLQFGRSRTIIDGGEISHPMIYLYCRGTLVHANLAMHLMGKSKAAGHNNAHHGEQKNSRDNSDGIGHAHR